MQTSNRKDWPSQDLSTARCSWGYMGSKPETSFQNLVECLNSKEWRLVLYSMSWYRPGAAVKATGRSWTTLCLAGHSLLSDCTSTSPTVLWLGMALLAVLDDVSAMGTETALLNVRLNHVGLWCLCQRRQGNIVRRCTVVLIVGKRILSHYFIILLLELWQASCWCILGKSDQVLEFIYIWLV